MHQKGQGSKRGLNHGTKEYWVYLRSVYIIAGLDSGRFNWSPEFHWSIYVIGIVLIVMGEIIFLAAQKQNEFFSSVMRIQQDREHTVCNTGVYRIVRHPAYFGNILSAIGIPLALVSLWCFIPIRK
ncbi:MAG: isoprenylcysteine carboxylmethyltransferase family protein [Bacteroidales bacterium]